MAQPLIFLEGELTLAAHDELLQPEAHECFGRGIQDSLLKTAPLSPGRYVVWLVEYGQFMSTEDVLSSPPHPEAICGNIRELFQLIRKLRRPLEGSTMVALGEQQTPYAHIYSGGVTYAFASGKPYWAKECRFIFLGASS
jgi:hypothetical protein